MRLPEEKCTEHPNPIDRNRAILLARDLLSLKDWVILSAKTSFLSSSRRVFPGDARELVSLSVLGPHERVLLDVLVRPDGAVNNELLKIHGCDPAHTFSAPSFREIHKILQAGFARRRVVCFAPGKVKEVLSHLCAAEKLEPIQASFVDMQFEYSRFLGHLEAGQKSYKLQALPAAYDCASAGVTPLTECRQLYILLQSMAASSQIIDSAARFDKNWSAAFYKPKLGPTDKIKEILGITD